MQTLPVSGQLAVVTHAGIPGGAQQQGGTVHTPPAGHSLAVVHGFPAFTPPTHCFGHGVGEGTGVAVGDGHGQFPPGHWVLC